ncbi:MAG: hypothetical protein ACXVBE_09730 [Bdellovibrionota bacterium]
MKFVVLFACIFFFATSLAHSEDEGERAIEGHPGWTLELIKPEPSVDGQPNYRTAYFVLKPPDKRPAASVTARVAEQVRSGEMGPEAAYSGGSSDSAAGKETSSGSGMSTGFSGGGFPASGVSSSLGNYAGVPLAGHNGSGSSSNPAAAPAEAPSVSPDARNGSGSSSSGTDSGTSAVSPVSITVNNAKSGTLETTAVAAACPTTTIENCSVSGGGGGVCTSGFTGSCSYTCSNGAWTKSQNSCSLAQVKACSSIEECMRVAGANFHLDGNTQAKIDSNAAYICSKIGKSTVVSKAASADSWQGNPGGRGGPKAYQMSLCAIGGGCQDNYAFGEPNAPPSLLQNGGSAVSSVECR